MVFVAELCCTPKSNSLTKILHINDTNIEIAINYNDSASELVIFKDQVSINAIKLPENDIFLLLFISINNSGHINIFFDCNQTSSPYYVLESNTVDLESAQYEIFNNVYSFKNMSEAMLDYKCNPQLTVLYGSILYFNDDFNSRGYTIMSFMHESVMFCLSYKNKQIYVENNQNEQQTIISLSSDHDFSQGLYLYFNFSSIEIYKSCPLTVNNESERVGVWNTTLFYNKLIIKTYRRFVLGNVASQQTLDSFCSNANLHKTEYNSSKCFPVEKNGDLFRKANSLFGNYLPKKQKIKKISTLNYVNNLYVVNKPQIVIASRFDSGYSFFDRTLIEYEDGFSDGENNFWLGLKLLNDLTSSGSFGLKIEAKSRLNMKYVEEYSLIKVENKKGNYKLKLGRLMSGKNGFFSNHNNTDFSTKDFGRRDLAEKHQAGFWLTEKNEACFSCLGNLNGRITSTKMSLSNAENEEFFRVRIILIVSKFLKMNYN